MTSKQSEADLFEWCQIRNKVIRELARESAIIGIRLFAGGEYD